VPFEITSGRAKFNSRGVFMRKLTAVSVGLLAIGLITMGSLGSSQTQTQKLRVGLGYLPDVQFAPFYLAQKSGLYAKKNLNVEFQHGYATELYPLLAAGKLDFVVADAEDVILLRAKDAKAAPFKYIMALYQSVPNALFSKAEKNIKTIKDLKGKNIGVPGKFGTSWTSLQATLRAANLKESDVTINEIGFTQLEAVLAGRVDVAMGFINNEPVVAAAQNIKLNVIPSGRYNRSAGNGVIATDAQLKNKDLVKRFLGASQDAIAAVIASPKNGFEAAKSYVQTMPADRLKVLEASVPLYESPYSKAQGLGFSNPNGWQDTLDLLKATGRITTPIARSSLYTNIFLTPNVQAAK
jgi:NitT/TauT family transport system substrate-binding protein